MHRGGLNRRFAHNGEVEAKKFRSESKAQARKLTDSKEVTITDVVKCWFDTRNKKDTMNKLKEALEKYHHVGKKY